MKNILFLSLLIILLIPSCATHQSYETSKFRKRSFIQTTIALNKDGLTADQIKSILSTKPPQNFPVDISVILITDGMVQKSDENQLLNSLVGELKKSKLIERVVILPNYIVPSNISFTALQELGIRALTEYVILFHIDGDELFQWTNIASSSWELSSNLSVLIFDSQTSAILTTEKVVSKKVYKTDIFETGEEEKAKKELYSEQGKFVGKIVNKVFSSAKE